VRLSGDGDADGLDRDPSRSAFGTESGGVGYPWNYDFDGDGLDNGQFNHRFGRV
jgi:hypothetical protein